MKESVLGAVNDGTTSFSGLVERLDAPVGDLFLTCRRLESEGYLAATGPLVFRLTEEGHARVERLARESGSPTTAGPHAGPAGGRDSGDSRDADEADEATEDGDEAAAGPFQRFDFRREYRERGGETTAGVDSAADSASAADDGSRRSAEPVAAGPGGDDRPLTAIEGIGSAYAERLRAAGITTVGELADADPEAVAPEVDVAESRLRRWRRRAL